MRFPSASNRPVIPCLLLILLAVQPATATLISQQTDPEHSGIDASLDILSAQIEQVGGELTFTIQTRGTIPTVLPDPSDVLTFLWFVDTDEDPETGQPHGEVGSEFNVRAVVGELYGGGFVDETGTEPGGGGGVVVIDGQTIRITIWLWQIADAADFNWRCASFAVTNGGYVQGNPDTAVSAAETIPFTPPARVTVTTPILELCPTGPATGQIEVEIRDVAGQILPNEEHRITYNSTYDAVATVDEAGLVTAIAPPQVHWQTPYIEVWADGLMADNSAVVRVNSIDVGAVHQLYPSEHVSFFIVPMIEGVDLDAITTGFEVVEATERAYMEQASGLGTVPTGGGMEYFVLDVANDPVTSVCGASGNPIRLGWTYGVPVHNSCYIVNDPANRVPQWFVIWHEMGHNFTCACNSFNLFCMSPSGPHNSAYVEGLASLAAMWSWKMVLAHPYGLGALARTNIGQQFDGSAENFRGAVDDYRTAGADYDTIDPDIVDGILLEMLDQYGMKCWFDLYSTFLPAEAPLPLAIDSKEKQATWFVAAMSASAGEDLRGLLSTEYGYPIDETAWPEILAAVEQKIAARPWVPVDVEEPGDTASGRGVTLAVTPNPVSNGAGIRFIATQRGSAELAIFELGGRQVRSLLSRIVEPGPHSAIWDGTDGQGREMPSGVYLCTLRVGGEDRTVKVTLLR